jgi:hypothetical protein
MLLLLVLEVICVPGVSVRQLLALHSDGSLIRTVLCNSLVDQLLTRLKEFSV